MPSDKFEVLKQYFGHDGFREGQEAAVDALISGHDAVCIMSTGAGKSICYQVPAMVLDGTAVVISPLISLMKDQVSALIKSGINAAFLNSSLSYDEYTRTLRELSSGQIKILYIAPERLEAADFREVIRKLRVSLVAVDEAHCVSQWGQDFRPSYLKIASFIASLESRPPVGAFTATATKGVREDIVNYLELRRPEMIITGFDRPNLWFSVMAPASKPQTLLALLRERPEQSGIVYCSTRKAVDEICSLLQSEGFSATKYHAGLGDEERKRNQEDFVYERSLIIVATNAFGMGIDKSNVRFVIHYNMPKNLENYYQEAGRAGRDGLPSDCILLYSAQDVRTAQYLINNGEPNPELSPEQLAELRLLDEKRLRQMTFYCRTSGCLRAHILRYFGENPPESCGHCSNCRSEYEERDITVDAQKILSCIIRTNQRYGEKVICAVLRGADTGKIRSAGLNRLSTFGIMRGWTDEKIREIINYLELNGYVLREGLEYPILKLTKKCLPVLRGNERLSMRVLKKRPAEARASSAFSGAGDAEINPELLRELKALRSEKAAEEHVPAYIIFADASLADMCAKLPTTPQAFLNVAGVGARKLERYGEEFIEIIKKYASEEAPRISVPERAPIPKSRQKRPEFSLGEEELSRFRFSDKPITASEIAKRLNGLSADEGAKKLTIKAILYFLKQENIMQPMENILGQTVFRPTMLGDELGIKTEVLSDATGSYTIVTYGRLAQEYIVQSLPDIAKINAERPWRDEQGEEGE